MKRITLNGRHANWIVPTDETNSINYAKNSGSITVLFILSNFLSRLQKALCRYSNPLWSAAEFSLQLFKQRQSKSLPSEPKAHVETLPSEPVADPSQALRKTIASLQQESCNAKTLLEQQTIIGKTTKRPRIFLLLAWKKLNQSSFRRRPRHHNSTNQSKTKEKTTADAHRIPTDRVRNLCERFDPTNSERLKLHRQFGHFDASEYECRKSRRPIFGFWQGPRTIVSWWLMPMPFNENQWQRLNYPIVE
jgi:hypothetical protein